MPFSGIRGYSISEQIILKASVVKAVFNYPDRYVYTAGYTVINHTNSIKHLRLSMASPKKTLNVSTFNSLPGDQSGDNFTFEAPADNKVFKFFLWDIADEEHPVLVGNVQFTYTA